MSTRQALSRIFRALALLAGLMGVFGPPAHAGFTISFGTDSFDGNPNDNVFQLKNGKLYLRGADWVVNVGPGNEVAIKPINVNAPVVVEAAFNAVIGGKPQPVIGVRLTNIMIKAQKDLNLFAITSSETKNFANPLQFGGVILDNNTVNYPNVANWSTSIMNTGRVDNVNLGAVNQKNDAKSAAGDFALLPRPTSTGAALNLPAGQHTIESKLDLTMQKGAVLILRGSGAAGVGPVPEPPSLVLAVPMGLLMLALVRRQRHTA